MRPSHILRGLLPWAVVAVQGWLIDRLLRRHGLVLLDQEEVRAGLERLERKARDLARREAYSGAGFGRTGAAASTAIVDTTSDAPSHADVVRAGQYAYCHRRQDDARAATPPYHTNRFQGAGIVIVAGGPRHYTNAWVCLTMLRRVLGCHLPIQVWYLSPHEMSPRMIELLQRFDVECVNAQEVQRRHPMRIAGGWECKPYALVHSPFKEVILLDADNVPLIDPATLLSWPEYRATGAVFWPDLGSLGREREIWEICRVAYRDEPEVESGQIVVDKERCWNALWLTLHLNDHSDYYYRHVNGDKETFHMAWRMLDQPYSMPPTRPVWITGLVSPGDPNFADVLLQHDFAGQPIFHHRTGAGWSAWGKNLRVPGFEHEVVCLDALRELRELWDGRVDVEQAVVAAPDAEAELLRARHVLYRLIGSDERVLTLLPGGKIGGGGSAWEQRWRVEQGQGVRTLVVEGQFGVTCRLALGQDGIWRGRWLRQEQVPVELWPLTDVIADERRTGRNERPEPDPAPRGGREGRSC
jgi:hypothetical protein